MSDRLLDLVRQYVDSCPPVKWVDWWFKMGEGEEKDAVEEILFDGESLRDLTDPTVKERLVDAATKNEEFMAAVLRSAAVDDSC